MNENDIETRRRQAARVRYESTSLTLDQVAEEVGVSSRTLKRWAKADGGWSKRVGPEISAAAHVVADRISAATASLPADAPPAVREAAIAQVAVAEAVDERAKLIDKHRREWRIVEGLVGEAVKARDPTAARLAETVARTLQTKQAGERKAWNLDAGENPPGSGITVVIERC
ncbi:hypothetical protein [Gulbenkiania mobilis]|uniref:hypothetical protein n=1 Tax=Gulbenkiania mobilis TaxID=397457 RepID=UPI0006BBE8A9|nr:hypothetical protein [Gulbenkiania mobilis]